MVYLIFLSLLFIIPTYISCDVSTTLMAGIKYKNFSTSMLEKPKLEGKSSNIIIGEYTSPSEIIFYLSNYAYYISNSLCIYIYIKQDDVTRSVLLNIDTNNNLYIERNISSYGLWYCFEPNNNMIHYMKGMSNLTVRINTDAKLDTNYPPFIEYYNDIINYDDKRIKRSHEHCTTKEKYLDLEKIDMHNDIIAPRGITFKYCKGHCSKQDGNFYSRSLYGIIATKLISLRIINSNDFIKCCSPESMENISIIYKDINGEVKKGELTDSNISKCVCK